MLRIINNPNQQSPICIPYNTNNRFLPGKLAIYVGAVQSIPCMISAIDPTVWQSNPGSIIMFGIFDDEYDPPNITCLNGLATVWELSDDLIIETDCYDKSLSYNVGDVLYPSINGNFTNIMSPGLPEVGTVDSILGGFKVHLLKQTQSKQQVLPIPGATMAGNVLVYNGTHGTMGWTPINVNGAGGVAVGASFVTVHNSAQNIGIPNNNLFPIGAKISGNENEVFNGVDFPNGTKGSVCKRCGNCNEYVLERDYLCYNCK